MKQPEYLATWDIVYYKYITVIRYNVG